MASLLSGTTIGGHVAVHANNISTYALTSVPASIYPTNVWIGNAIYFGGGNNYLNWDGARINSNVSIQSGVDMRAPIFYDSNNTDYYLNPNGNSVLSTVQFNDGITDNGNVRIYMPGNAWSVNNPSGTGGAIKISLPTGAFGVNTMMSMTVHVYEYSTGQSFTIKLGGYNYYTHDWYNVFAYMVNDSGKGGDVPVYFGNDGTRDVIWIGEPGWSWSYPNVFVTDFQAGHSQYSAWKTGWNVSFDTSSRTNVSQSRTAYRQIDTGTIGSQSVNYANSAGSVAWTNVSSRPTALSQFTNDSGYITGYTETDTLTSVTGRGNVATGDIYLPSSGNHFRARYTAGSNNYHSSLNWYGLQLGNNGDNYIVAGRTNTGGHLRFYVNNTSDFTSINGTLSAIMHASGRTTFGGTTDYGYTLNVAGSFFATDWIRVNGPQGLYFESYGGGWRMTDSSYIRSYNGKSLSMEGASVDYVSSIYMNGGVYVQTYNNRNLLIKSTGGSDSGILGRGSSDQFAYQIYGDGGGSYGFLGYAWGDWDLRKVPDGALYMNDNNSYYINTNGTSNFYALNIQGNAVIHSGNIGSQSVSYATSAGSASVATSAGSVDGLTINNSGDPINPDNVTQNQIGYNTSVSLYGQTDGGLYSSAYSSSWIHQIYGDFRTGQIAIRGKNSGTWQDWRYVLDDKNIGSYAVPYGNMTGSTGLNDNKLYLRTNGDNNHYLWNAADDWEELVYYTGTGFRIKGSTGVVAGYFTDSEVKLNARLTVGNFPQSTTNTGEAWVGRANDRNTGTLTVQLGGNSASSRSFEVVDYAWSTVLFSVNSNNTVSVNNYLEAGSSLRAPIFYDSQDTGYYGDFAGTSKFNKWWSTDNGNNGYAPRWDTSAYVLQSQHWYGHTNTQSMYLGEANTIYVRDTAIATESFRAPIFYDSNDTGYYLDPNGTSNLLQLNTATRARWGMPRWWNDRSSFISDQGYWTGTNGWTTSQGTWANAWKGGFSGWDIWGTSTDHPQGAGTIHAQGIVSGQHYASSDGGEAYGWMMVGAHAATENRYWLRGKWGTNTSGWVEMITTGNIGSQSVNNANTLGGYGRGNTTNTIAYWDGTRNLYVNNPESYTGEVRLGAAWSRGGVYASSTLSMATSGGAIDFVSNDTTIGAFRWDSTNGSRFIVGENVTTTPYTLIDSNKRPVIYQRGQYPVLTLDHTVTSNGVHGPTIQFVHNGYQGNQWVIGTNGPGTRLDIGFSNTAEFGNTSYNPHNGIGGYNGKTLVRMTSAGVAIGSLGTYPTVIEPAYTLDVRGNSYSSGNLKVDGFVNVNGATEHTVNDNGSVVHGTTTNNRVFINGSIQLTNNNDAIVIGRGASTFLTDEEIGFGWGGGWYMTEGSYIRSRGSKSLHMNGGSVDYVGSMYLEGSGTYAHLQPNSGSYGSLQITNSKGSWSGIRFTASNVNIMANPSESGFHNNDNGWQILWSQGTLYIGKGTYGGSNATVWDSSNAPRANYGNLMYYQGFNLDANTMDSNSTGFTYQVNAPTYGPIVRFSTGGGYDLWLNSDYWEETTYTLEQETATPHHSIAGEEH